MFTSAYMGAFHITFTFFASCSGGLIVIKFFLKTNTIKIAQLWLQWCRPAQAEDSVMAFGPLAANHFGARFAQISWAGAGLLPGNNGKGTPSIPQLYNRTLPREAASTWNHASFVPQVRACAGMCTHHPRTLCSRLPSDCKRLPMPCLLALPVVPLCPSLACL